MKKDMLNISNSWLCQDKLTLEKCTKNKPIKKEPSLIIEKSKSCKKDGDVFTQIPFNVGNEVAFLLSQSFSFQFEIKLMYEKCTAFSISTREMICSLRI